MNDVLLVLSTCPDKDCAEKIARSLVDQGLAACVNISPQVTSVYTWQGKTESAEEVLLLIKTSARRYAQLQQVLRSLHPYELPEIIAVPVTQGLPEYLNWVDQCTNTETSAHSG